MCNRLAIWPRSLSLAFWSDRKKKKKNERGVATPTPLVRRGLKRRKKKLSQQNFIMNASIYIYTLKRTYSRKKSIISKWRQNYRFSLLHYFDFAKTWKNTFPKELFNKIWLIIGEYITEIKIGNIYSYGVLGEKLFLHPLDILC